MNADDKKRFVNELLDSVKKDVLSKIDKMPEEWDGLELRELIASKFNDAKHMSSTITSHARFKQRLREFENTVIVNNL